jgi:Protein of unknown function (DUF3788)
MSVKTKTKPQKSQPPPNAFVGKKTVPTEKELATVLGDTKPIWDQLITCLHSEEFKVRDGEWKCPAPKYGWSLRLKRARRNIVYLIPQTERFSVAFALGKNAVNAAKASDLPDEIKRLIDSSPVYPEGTGVRFEVRSLEDVATVVKLARLKLEN